MMFAAIGKKYRTIVADPPWPLPMSGLGQRRVNGQHARLEQELPYETMSLKEIRCLRIADLAAEDAVLFCWTTNRFLRDAFEIVEGWGARFAFVMTWVKGGGIQTPVTPCFNAEFIVVGKFGRPVWLETKAFQTANFWPRREHSEKPEEFYDLLRRVSPAPRVDIFNRRPIAGFDSIGDESRDSSHMPAHYQAVLL